MARTSKIRIQVQVDRLPDVQNFVQLGLRVSGAVVPMAGSTDGAIGSDDARLLPWKWLDKNVAANRWNPHDKKSWKIWRQRNGSMTLDPNPIAEADVNVLDRNDAGYADFELTKFTTRIDEEIKAIVALVGHRQAFEIPSKDDGVLSGRTAFGLAESLTALPNPVPVAMNVWTAAWIDKNNIANFHPDDRFVAVPVFGVTDATYEPDGTFTNGGGGMWTAGITTVPSGADALAATAVVHSSLPFSALEIGASTERMIDASQLLIRTRKTHQFEGGDWIAAAGLRIAEAIDPAARAMAVLDTTIDEFVRTKTEARREALRLDMTGPDLLRTALKRLHEPVIASRTQRSESATAPAASFVQAVAERAPNLWPSVVPLLFAQAAAETDKILPAISAPFDVTSCSRILGAAGIPPSPGLVLVDETNSASTPVPLLDSQSGFVDWLLTHWFSDPKPAGATTKILFDTYLRFIKRGDSATPSEMKTVPAGVVSFVKVPRPALAPIEIPIGIGRPEAVPSKVTVTFQTQGTRSGASVAVVMNYLAGDKMSFEVPGHAAAKTIDTPARAVLSFVVNLPAMDQEPSLAIKLKPGDKPVEDVARIPGATLLLSGPVSIALESEKPLVAAIDMTGIAIPTVDRDPLVRQAQALRGALSWAYASPMVPALLQGWAPLPGKPVPDVPEQSLAQRLVDAAAVFIEKWFEEPFKNAKAGLPGDLLDLFDLLEKKAVEDANALIAAIVPPALDEADRVTQDALPLAFLIAQLQDFDPNEDLWGRLAGVGVLISRDPEVGGDKWWSLNAATLHVPTITNGERPSLDEGNAVRTATQDGDKWQIASKVDPVPLAVGDVGGVRAALVKYENHSIVGELEGAPQLDPAGPAGATARRPEAFFFPTRNFTRMPALTFGREYSVLPYLIGHGGALPLALRAKPLNPVKPVEIKNGDNDSFVIGTIPKPADDTNYVHVRKLKYLRTVPVSAPRIADSQWPAPFPGVDPLADELPLRPPPVTVSPGADARFFIDNERLTGLLAARGTAVRIDTGEIHIPKNSENATLEIRVESRGAAQAALSVKVEMAKLAAAAGGLPFGVRIEAAEKAHTIVSVVKRRDQIHADDEPDVKKLENGVAITRDSDVETWQACYVRLRAIDGALDVEPPAIRWGALGDGQKLIVEGDRPVLPPEIAHAMRKVTVLDGIKTGTLTGPNRISLTLRRPAAPVATYERWINGPTGKHGTANRDKIRDAIHAARERSTTLGKGDRSLDDPAVETLFVEVVQLFPRRVPRAITLNNISTSGPVAIRNPISQQLETIIGLEGKEVFSRNFASITADVLTTGLPDSDEDDRDVGTLDPKEGKLALHLTPGCTYEIRVYAAMPPEQSLFSPNKLATRFSSAVRASWRDVRNQNGDILWHLGTPLTLTVEVATDIMPECWPRLEADATKPDFTSPLFEVTVERPPRVIEDRATVRLVPERFGPPIVNRVRRPDLQYAASRYTNRAALMHQRWSWRGRPLPELLVDADAPFGTEGNAVERKLGDFIDAAFFGRADDDIGPVREVAFGRAHASGGRPLMEEKDTSGTRPVLLEHDLDRRLGTHLWRFALRLMSRYAAMRPNHPDLMRFSHMQKEAPRALWWPVVVPDRVHPERPARAVARPGLMLVVPLTEASMLAGSVPPLLATFNQELFPQFNAADGIEAVIDIARHPLPGIKRIDEATHGAVFGKAWEAVEAARNALREPEAAYARSVALDSRESKEEQERARVARDKALDVLNQAEAAFRKVQLEAGAEDATSIVGRPVNPNTKYYQEIAPDPIRDASPAADRPVAVRVDGPVGYTFDAGVEAGRFDHSAVLVSPVAEVIRPGSFIRLRFRRLEAPGVLLASDAPPISPDRPATLDPALVEVQKGGALFLIENPVVGSKRPDVANDVHLFRTVYDGLAFDIPDLATSPASVRFRLASPRDAALPCATEAQHTTVDASIEGSADTRRIVVSAHTHLGKSATWSLPLAADAKARVQAVVSLRPRPVNLAGDEKKKFVPVADVSVRVRIDRNDRDSLRRPQENAWLSVLCMPLTTKDEFTDLVAVQVCPVSPEKLPVRVTPLRLSDFTPGVWCQFAANMSRFRIEAATNAPRIIEDVLPVSAIHVKLTEDSKTFEIGLNGLREGEVATSMTLTTEGDPDEDAQIEEPAYAVVTRFIHDAFDRLRERVIGIHPVLPSSKTFGPRIWPESELKHEPYSNGIGGRVRFLRVLRGKVRDDGGFERSLQEFPKHFFGRESDEALDAEPLDAAGMAMGISAPIDWAVKAEGDA